MLSKRLLFDVWLCLAVFPVALRLFRPSKLFARRNEVGLMCFKGQALQVGRLGNELEDPGLTGDLL